MPTQEVTSSPPVVGEGMAPPTEQQQVLLAVLTGGRTAAVAEQAFSDLNSSLGSGSSGDLEKCVRGGIPRIASHPELCQLLPSVPTSPFSWPSRSPQANSAPTESVLAATPRSVARASPPISQRTVAAASNGKRSRRSSSPTPSPPNWPSQLPSCASGASQFHLSTSAAGSMNSPCRGESAALEELLRMRSSGSGS
eukprot:jgi/Astpho2/6320/Aster-08152